MTDLIIQLFDIATNEEFSESQRKELMRVALDEVGMLDKLYPIRGISPAAMALPAAREIKEMALNLTVNIDETLGRALTKERTPDGIRFGLASIPTD